MASLYFISALLGTVRLSQAVDIFYPDPINPVLGKSVTLSPEGATCGSEGSEFICESRTNPVSDCSTFTARCDMSCPYGDSLPYWIDVFSTVQTWQTDCIVKDTDAAHFPPSQHLQTGFSAEFKATQSTGNPCFLVLKYAEMLSIQLAGEWSVSLTMWIKPELQITDTG